MPTKHGATSGRLIRLIEKKNKKEVMLKIRVQKGRSDDEWYAHEDTQDPIVGWFGHKGQTADEACVNLLRDYCNLITEGKLKVEQLVPVRHVRTRAEVDKDIAECVRKFQSLMDRCKDKSKIFSVQSFNIEGEVTDSGADIERLLAEETSD